MKIGFIENIIDYVDSYRGETMLGWYQLLKEEHECSFIQWDPDILKCRVEQEFNREKIAINFIKEDKDFLEQYDMLISSMPTTDPYYLTVLGSLQKPLTMYLELSRDAKELKNGMKQNGYLTKAFKAYDYVVAYESELLKDLMPLENPSEFLDKLKSMNILSYYTDPEVLLEAPDVLENLPAFAYQSEEMYDDKLRDSLIEKFKSEVDTIKSKVVFEFLVVKDKHLGRSKDLLSQAIKSMLKGRIPIVNASLSGYMLFEDSLKDYRPLITYEGKEDLFEKIKNFDYEVVADSVKDLQDYYRAKDLCKSFVAILVTPDKAFDVYKEMYKAIEEKESLIL